MSRLRRSWRGALLDIVLIVGSILIAFALDAWWDGRTRSEKSAARFRRLRLRRVRRRDDLRPEPGRHRSHRVLGATGLSSRAFLARADPAAEDDPDQNGRRELIEAMLNEPELAELVAALGSSLEGLLFELREVELRLDALQTAVASELGDPVPG